MPVYDYKCKECGTTFEVFYTTLSSTEKEEPDEKCPKCDSKKKVRQVSKNTSFVLKGKGWARDRYS